MSDLLVHARSLGKSYPLVSRRDARLRALMRLLAGRRPEQMHHALAPIDLDIERGQSTAIVGENGAGKSTLLKLITGVLTPNTGSIQVNGTVGALLELGAGFHPEYSGSENLRMAAALAGLSASERRQRMGQIIDFADIGTYIDEPIKHYSTGMVVRLGFAIVAAIKPDLLITDEVLAVGDESFQKKCVHWIESYLQQGGTLLLVSHSMYHVQKLCQTAIWLESGRVQLRGGAHEVAQAYLAHHERKSRVRSESSIAALADQPFAVDRWSIDDHELPERLVLESGQAKMRVEVDLRADEGQQPALMFGLAKASGQALYGVSSEMDSAAPLRVSKACYRYVFELDLSSLLPGEYVLKLHPMDGQGLRLFEAVEVILLIRGSSLELGAVRLPHRWLTA